MVLDELTQSMLTLAGYYYPHVGPVGQEHKYSTVMANLSRPISNRIADWGQYYIPDMELYWKPDDSSFGRQYQIHVTVKYGLHTNNPLDILRLAQSKRVTPFLVHLGKVNIFDESSNYDVVTIECSGEGLIALNDLVSSSFINSDTHPEYHPHATVAYVKKGMGRAHIGSSEFEGLEARIDRLTFSAKDGRETAVPLYGVEL